MNRQKYNWISRSSKFEIKCICEKCVHRERWEIIIISATAVEKIFIYFALYVWKIPPKSESESRQRICLRYWMWWVFYLVAYRMHGEQYYIRLRNALTLAAKYGSSAHCCYRIGVIKNANQWTKRDFPIIRILFSKLKRTVLKCINHIYIPNKTDLIASICIVHTQAI